MTIYGESYASFADYDRELSRAETDERLKDRIVNALVVATDKINQEIGFDFFLHESAIWYPRRIDIDRGVIHAHQGIVSVTGIRVRSGRTADWESLDTTDWDLETRANGTGLPYDHIVLNGTGTVRTSWQTGYERLTEITGERGWVQPPIRAIDANVDWARQDMAADRTYPGGTQTPDQSGIPARTVLPDSVIRLRQWALNRFACDT